MVLSDPLFLFAFFEAAFSALWRTKSARVSPSGTIYGLQDSRFFALFGGSSGDSALLRLTGGPLHHGTPPRGEAFRNAFVPGRTMAW